LVLTSGVPPHSMHHLSYADQLAPQLGGGLFQSIPPAEVAKVTMRKQKSRKTRPPIIRIWFLFVGDIMDVNQFPFVFLSMRNLLRQDFNGGTKSYTKLK